MIGQDDTQQLMRDLKEIFRRLDDLEANPFSVSGSAVPAAGTQYNHLEDNGAIWTSVTNLTLPDDAYIGLPGPGGRLAFDLTPAPDQLKVTDADLNFVTAAHGIIHVDGVAPGMVLRADGTRYVPAAAALTLPLPPVAVGDTLIATAGPAWNILTTPGAAGYARVSTATTETWSQAPEWTGFGHTWSSAVSARPILTVKNTNADTESGSIFFFKDSSSPADDDDLGIIEFFGRTSTAAAERYAYILAESSDVTNADTGGSLDFLVVMNAVEQSLLRIQGFNGVVGQGEVVVNAGGLDVDFIVRAVGAANALKVQGLDGRVGMNVAAPGAQLSIDQSDNAANIPALKIDQEDVSEPCIQFSVSGADADIVLWELEVTGTPSLLWDESQDALQFSHALSIRATPALADGLYVPWKSGDALGATAYFGSDNASNDQTAVFAISDSETAIIGLSEDDHGIFGRTNAADIAVNGVWGSATDTGRGVYGTSGPGIGGEFVSGTGYALIANLTGAGSAIVEFRDNGTPVLTIQDGGQADFAEYLRHLGDVDTFWRFQTDQASLDCGGVSFIDAREQVAAQDYLNLHAGLVGINETANANMSIGLTIDQAANDDEILNFRSSDVGVVRSNLVETGTWFTAEKSQGSSGGAVLRGFKDSSGFNYGALQLSGYLEEDTDIDKTTAAHGIVEIFGLQTDQTNNENTVADGNVVVFRTQRGGSLVTTQWFDEDGDIGYGGALVAFDDLDDAGMARDLQLVLTGRQGVRYNQAKMVEAGILHPSEHGVMVSHKRMTALQLGAHAQAYDDRRRLEARIEYLEEQLRQCQ